MSGHHQKRAAAGQAGLAGLELVENGSAAAFAVTTTQNFSTSLQEGDLVIVGISAAGYSGTNNVLSAGWTEIYNAAATNPVLRVFAKQMGATPDTSFDWQGGHPSTVKGCMCYSVWRGADTTDWTGGSTLVATSNTGYGPDPGSHTTTADNAIRILFGGIDDDNITSCTPPTDFTLTDWLNASGASYGGGSMMAYKLEETAGALDPPAFALSHTDACRSVHFSIVPA